METALFLENYRKAFGESTPLPIGFWYSDTPFAEPQQINGCLFKGMEQVRSGTPITLSAETTTCGGGKFYAGFTAMPEHVPVFVSQKEKYKQSPELVLDYLEQLQIPRSRKPYLNFARLDSVDKLEEMEGILFIATPDVLAGLSTWAFFDNNAPDAVATPFGSACCTTITMAVIENLRDGKRCFIGGFDPSVRPWFGPNELTFVIPRNRFREMYHTMPDSCLFDTHAWGKVRERIDS